VAGLQVNKVVCGAAVIFTGVRRVDLRRCELLDSRSLATFARRSGSQLRVRKLLLCHGSSVSSED